jgi:hypothetical protein
MSIREKRALMRDQAKCVKEMRLSENEEMADEEDSDDVSRNNRKGRAKVQKISNLDTMLNMRALRMGSARPSNTTSLDQYAYGKRTLKKISQSSSSSLRDD